MLLNAIQCCLKREQTDCRIKKKLNHTSRPKNENVCILYFYFLEFHLNWNRVPFVNKDQ